MYSKGGLYDSSWPEKQNEINTKGSSKEKPILH
jgi:hypothetical protein